MHGLRHLGVVLVLAGGLGAAAPAAAALVTIKEASRAAAGADHTIVPGLPTTNGPKLGTGAGFDGDLGIGDRLVLLGNIGPQADNFRFTIAHGLGTVVLDSLVAGNLLQQQVRFDLAGAAMDAVGPFNAATALPLFAGLRPGDYSLTTAGAVGLGTSRYDIFVAVTPIPGTALLLLPALTALGLVARRPLSAPRPRA